MPLSKRSYERQENMLGGKNFVYSNLFGDYIDKNPFGQAYDKERALKGLSPQGKKIIGTFIEQNKEKEEMLIKKEKELVHEKHDYVLAKNTKPFWKNGANVMEYFGPLIIDKFHKFRPPPVREYDLNQPPFRRPKAQGDYIDKKIYPLGPSYPTHINK